MVLHQSKFRNTVIYSMLHTSPTGRVCPFVLLISTHLLILILRILNNVTETSERWEVLS